jgi:uncharacterized protein (TIGR02271 family)
MDRDDFTPEAGDEDILLHEERISTVDRAWRGIGYVRARKRVGTYRVDQDVPREVEDVELERRPVEEGDSGKIERLADGAISIPVYEEEVVIEKRTVLKERIVLRKVTVTETERVRTDLRKERVEIEADPGVEVRFDDDTPDRA